MKKPTWENQTGKGGVTESSWMQLPEHFTIVVHHYIGYPKDQWLLSIFPNVVKNHLLENKRLDEAKKEALAIAREIFKNVVDALGA